nr:hypothetical protein [Tanacetum cinerariifolium]
MTTSGSIQVKTDNASDMMGRPFLSYDGVTQANMDVCDLDYIDVRLEKIRFLGFQTSKNNTSLLFGRFTRFENMPNDGFPNHYFRSEAHNELDARKTVRNAIFACNI